MVGMLSPRLPCVCVRTVIARGRERERERERAISGLDVMMKMVSRSEKMLVSASKCILFATTELLV